MASRRLLIFDLAMAVVLAGLLALLAMAAWYVAIVAGYLAVVLVVPPLVVGFVLLSATSVVQAVRVLHRALYAWVDGRPERAEARRQRSTQRRLLRMTPAERVSNAIGVLEDSDRPVVERFEAARFLGDFGMDAQVVAALMRALYDPAWKVRWGAVLSCGKIPSKEIVGTLLELRSQESDETVKNAINDALASFLSCTHPVQEAYKSMLDEEAAAHYGRRTTVTGAYD